MANLAAYAILATIVASGGIFLIRELRGRASEDLSDQLIQNNWPHLPTINPSRGE